MRSDGTIFRITDIVNAQAKLEESIETIILTENYVDQQVPYAREERKVDNEDLNVLINKPDPPADPMLQTTPKKPKESSEATQE